MRIMPILLALLASSSMALTAPPADAGDAGGYVECRLVPCDPVRCDDGFECFDGCTQFGCAALPCEPAECVGDACGGGACTPGVPRTKYVPGSEACRDGETYFTFSFWTGSNGAGQPQPDGEPDPLWHVSPAGAAYSKTIDIPSVWNVPPPEGTWINPSFRAGVAAPPGEYVYTAHYTIPPEAYDVRMDGWLSADYGANYQDVGPSGSDHAFASRNQAMYLGPWAVQYAVRPGPHTVSVHVWNDGASMNPTGLLMEAVVTGRCAPFVAGADACKGEATGFSFPVSTGLDRTGAPLPPDTMDPRWSMDGGPTWNHDGHSAWVSAASARWIDFWPQLMNQPPGIYAYTMPFLIPSNAYDVTITGRFAADNHAALSLAHARATLRLGETEPVSGFDEWTSFSGPVRFTGSNVLTATVENLDRVTGLILEGTVQGLCGASSSLPGDVAR